MLRRANRNADCNLIRLQAVNRLNRDQVVIQAQSMSLFNSNITNTSTLQRLISIIFNIAHFRILMKKHVDAHVNATSECTSTDDVFQILPDSTDTLFYRWTILYQFFIIYFRVIRVTHISVSHTVQKVAACDCIAVIARSHRLAKRHVICFDLHSIKHLTLFQVKSRQICLHDHPRPRPACKW